MKESKVLLEAYIFVAAHLIYCVIVLRVCIRTCVCAMFVSSLTLMNKPLTGKLEAVCEKYRPVLYFCSFCELSIK